MNRYRPTILAVILTIATQIFCIPASAQEDDLGKTGNVPIAFYGKIVDQSNQPVAGVSISAQLKYGYLTSKDSGTEKHKPISVVSDANGNFEIDNEIGNFLRFEKIEKEGYKLLGKQEKAGFMYYPKQFTPDISNPVVFKMWKKAGAEHLIQSGWRGNVICDGRLLTFSLETGKQSKEGDLQIVCSRDPLDIIPREHTRYDYSLKVAVIGGGVMSTLDEFTFLAPEEGYLPSITLGAKADDPNWKGAVRQEFYIKTADGHYGRLLIDWYGDLTSPTHLEWNSDLNPSGSRNLER